MRIEHCLLGLVSTVAILAACSTGDSGIKSRSPDDPQTSGSVAATTGGTSGGDGIDLDVGNQSSAATCASALDEDRDGDGWTVADGDCNDCDVNVNPGAIEVIDTKVDADGKAPLPADEDCDGTVDNVEAPCDDGLALDDVDPRSAARAIDLCKFTAETPASRKDKTWGVLDVNYVRADGTVFKTPGVQVGIQPDFGPHVNVQNGKRMLAMSSGHARTKMQPDVCPTYDCFNNDNHFNSVHGPPAGFPQSVPNCAQSPYINDDLGLEVKLRAPTNATGYTFDFDFYSFEFPDWVCTHYNDQFVALVDPPPPGAINGNISFDSLKNPVSVNIAFFGVCSPQSIDRFSQFCAAPDVCPTAPVPYCPNGPSELMGSGFDINPADDAGATSWLKSKAPIQGGAEFSIRFTIWDTGDLGHDSTVLVDNFQWVANGGNVSVSTDPIATPR